MTPETRHAFDPAVVALAARGAARAARAAGDAEAVRVFAALYRDASALAA